MRKLEAILKEKGWTDEDLKSVEPMLSNQKFRDSLESEIANQEYLAEVGKKDAAEALRWREEEALPTLQKHMDSERAARAELASTREQLKVLQEQGLIKLDEQKKDPPKNDPPKAFDPKEHKLVTMDDVAVFAEAEGQAIVTINDLAAEYSELFGKSIFSYVDSATGRKGMSALREEAKLAKAKDLSDFVSRKFDFAGKRAELAKKDAEEREKAIRADERAKAMAELANPNLRTPAASLLPFTRVKRDEKDSLPWENVEERRSGRVDRATKAELLRA